MILATFKNPVFINIYLELIKKEIRLFIKLYGNLLKGINTLFTDDQIDKAIDTIRVSSRSIYCPTTGLNGKILRALEYGTSNNKSYHIISSATKKVLKGVKDYEYGL